MPRRCADIPLIIDRLLCRRCGARARRPTTATRARRPRRRFGLEPILTFPAVVPSASCRPTKLRAPYPAHRDGRGPCIVCICDVATGSRMDYTSRAVPLSYSAQLRPELNVRSTEMKIRQRRGLNTAIVSERSEIVHLEEKINL